MPPLQIATGDKAERLRIPTRKLDVLGDRLDLGEVARPVAVAPVDNFALPKEDRFPLAFRLDVGGKLCERLRFQHRK